MAGRADIVNGLNAISKRNYNDDINYSFEWNRWLLKPIGVWPCKSDTPWPKKLVYRFLILMYSFLILLLVVCSTLYIFLDIQDIEMRLRRIGPISYCLMALIKYWFLILHEKDIRNCMDYMEDDWKNVKCQKDRQLMLESTLFGRRITVISATFTFGGVFFYQTVLSLTSSKIVVGNFTFRPLVYPVSKVIIDIRRSPANELMILAQSVLGIVMNAVTVGSCNLAALCALHACGQLKILMSRLNNLVDGCTNKKNTVDERLADIVKLHVRILSFISFTEYSLKEISLVEVLGCTMNMCMLGYYSITDWNNGQVISSITYFTLIVSFAFNIFIFCYIGEVLFEECKKVAETTYMINWYQLSGKKPLSLLLIMAISSSSIRLTAGKFVNLSINSFGDIIKTSVAYLNVLRTITS
ncbi:hypothetical protein KPH14_009218 [Odynerus spinipes]|uniref:Odorant receptor n=1 Tax=Odynerus spinipes TaxID=1348599 RepID=A0AAD9RP62_9HYME|nr:hypothetical protein KPH14_009218 [Odynerus spinipes]